MNEQKPRRRGLYWKFLILLALVNTLLILIGMQYLLKVLTAYEAATPNTALRAYFSALAVGDTGHARADADYEPDGVSDWDDFDDAMLDMFGYRDSSRLRYRRIASNDPDGRLVYAVYDRDEKLGEVYLYEKKSGDVTAWRIVAPLPSVEPVTLRVPSDARVLVNGVELTEDDVLSREPLEPELFEWLPEGYSAPWLVSYKAEGVLSAPKVEILPPEGTVLEIDRDDALRHIEARAYETGELADTISARMELVAKAYSTYISRDGTLYNLMQYLYPNTDFSARMTGFDNQWYGTHYGYNFRDMEVSKLRHCAPDVIVGDISFVFEVTTGADTHDFPSHYTLLFVKTNSQWMLVDLMVN